MREIWPTEEKKLKTLAATNKTFRLTEEDYKAILAALDEVRETEALDEQALANYKEAMANAVTTLILTSNLINARKADITEIVSESIEADSADITRISSNEITAVLAEITRGVFNRIEASEATIPLIAGTDANFTNLTSVNITADDIEVTGTLTVDQSNWNNATIENADITRASIDDLSSSKANIENLESEEATVDSLIAESARIAKSDLIKANYRYLTHKEDYNKQVLSEYSVVSDFYLVFPKVLNGRMNVIAEKADGTMAFSVEDFNSIQNNWFAWSCPNKPYLIDVEFYTDEVTNIEYLQIHGKILGDQLTLYSCSDSYDNENPISIYNYKYYDSSKDFDITERNGIYLPNAVFAGKFHAEELLIDNVVFEVVTINKAIKLPTSYDEYGTPVNYSTGNAGDYITVTEEDKFGNTGLKWQAATHNLEPTNAIERKILITESTLGNYTGILESEGTENTAIFSDINSLIEESSEDLLYRLQGEYKKILSADTITYPAQYEKIEYEELNPTILDKHIGETDLYIVSYDLENNTVTDNEGTEYNFSDIQNNIYLKTADESSAYYLRLADDISIEIESADTTITYYTNVGELEYNITHLGNETVTHGAHEVTGDLTVDGDTLLKSDVTVPVSHTDEEGNTVNNSVKLPNFYNGPEATLTDGLNIQNNLKDEDNNPLPARITRNRNFEVDGEVVLKKDPIAVMNEDGDWDEDHDKKPVVYNYERDSLQPADSLTIDSLEVDYLKVNHDADVGGDVRIAGDLYVSGTSHIVDEETVSTTGDTLVLRQNATTGLNEGQVSGIVINNYEVDSEGNAKDLSLVTDRDGTLRVGTGTGTVTSYSKIAWNESERKWYSYDDTDPDDIQYTILATQPTGTVTDYQGKTEKAPYTLYSSVTFTVIDKTTLQPLLTRDEEEDISNQAILKYDKSAHKATALPLPTVNGQQLTGNITTDEEGNTTYSYSWSGTSKPAIFRFATREEYEEALEITEGNTGYIPDGSLVVIDEEVNNVMEEETE